MNNKDIFEKSITINTSSVWIGDPIYALSHEQFVDFCDEYQVNNNDSITIGEFSLEDEIAMEDDLVGYFYGW